MAVEDDARKLAGEEVLYLTWGSSIAVYSLIFRGRLYENSQSEWIFVATPLSGAGAGPTSVDIRIGQITSALGWQSSTVVGSGIQLHSPLGQPPAVPTLVIGQSPPAWLAT
jgi:hypothetical protein